MQNYYDFCKNSSNEIKKEELSALKLEIEKLIKYQIMMNIHHINIMNVKVVVKF
jgi:hypothetical protein